MVTHKRNDYRYNPDLMKHEPGPMVRWLKIMPPSSRRERLSLRKGRRAR